MKEGQRDICGELERQYNQYKTGQADGTGADKRQPQSQSELQSRAIVVECGSTQRSNLALT